MSGHFDRSKFQDCVTVGVQRHSVRCRKLGPDCYHTSTHKVYHLSEVPESLQVSRLSPGLSPKPARPKQQLLFRTCFCRRRLPIRTIKIPYFNPIPTTKIPYFNPFELIYLIGYNSVLAENWPLVCYAHTNGFSKSY